MKLEVMDANTLTLAEIISNAEDLFYIVDGNLHKYKLQSLADSGIQVDGDYILVKITDEDPEPEVVVEEQPKVEESKKKPKGNQYSAPLTYKFFGNDSTESIFVEFRPTGDIRVSFKDKESAQAYFEYFRDQFYISTTGASAITVYTIYKDLNLVNWKEKEADCDTWGWKTLSNGPCRYITEVRKNVNNMRFGFTLRKPTKLK